VVYIVPILLTLPFFLSFCEGKSFGKKVEKGGWEFACCFGSFHFWLAMAFTDRSGVGRSCMSLSLLGAPLLVLAGENNEN
jgi:hypothetical protein